MLNCTKKHHCYIIIIVSTSTLSSILKLQTFWAKKNLPSEQNNDKHSVKYTCYTLLCFLIKISSSWWMLRLMWIASPISPFVYVQSLKSQNKNLCSIHYYIYVFFSPNFLHYFNFYFRWLQSLQTLALEKDWCFINYRKRECFFSF